MVANNKTVKDYKARLLRFIQTLVELCQQDHVQSTEAKPAPASTSAMYFPYRPYLRPQVRSVSVTEYGPMTRMAAFQSSFEEAELDQHGGRESVLASIHRHLPSTSRRLNQLVDQLG
jgi:hypothetical protein